MCFHKRGIISRHRTTGCSPYMQALNKFCQGVPSERSPFKNLGAGERQRREQERTKSNTKNRNVAMELITLKLK